MEGFLPRLLVPERLDFDVLVPARIAYPRRAKAEMRRSKVMEYCSEPSIRPPIHCHGMFAAVPEG
jgi:hypothetical protein